MMGRGARISVVRGVEPPTPRFSGAPNGSKLASPGEAGLAGEPRTVRACHDLSWSGTDGMPNAINESHDILGRSDDLPADGPLCGWMAEPYGRSSRESSWSVVRLGAAAGLRATLPFARVRPPRGVWRHEDREDVGAVVGDPLLAEIELPGGAAAVELGASRRVPPARAPRALGMAASPRCLIATASSSRLATGIRTRSRTGRRPQRSFDLHPVRSLDEVAVRTGATAHSPAPDNNRRSQVGDTGRCDLVPDREATTGYCMPGTRSWAWVRGMPTARVGGNGT